MKALSLLQPWASALFATRTVAGDAIRLKANETRSWSTRYRGSLLILASKGWDRLDAVGPDMAMAGWRDPFAGLITVSDVRLQAMTCSDGDAHAAWRLPLGAAVGVVDLVDCVPTQSLHGQVTEWEWAMGNYAPGRFAWITAHPRPLYRPVPYPGRLGIWEVPGELQAEIERQGIETT